MSDGIYAALSGAIASERSLDVVANNVANVGTTGFRGERLAFHEVVSQQAQQGPTPTTLRYTEIEESRVDLSEGPLRETGNPLDLAISGDAFFAVRTPDGQDRYTRDGSFVVGAGGVLTTRSGAIVRADVPDGSSAQPTPIVVPPGTTSVSVAPDGTLSAGEQTIGRVALVRFERASDLSPDGSAMLTARQGVTPVQATEATVVQGFLEGANVGPITGMNELITASRTFESFQRVIHAFQTLDERTARDLAKG